MKIILVGPGILEIPPRGWGAIEILIADQAEMLKRSGYDVHIVNERNKQKAIEQINIENGDVVHLHYDEHIDWVKEIKCKKIFIKEIKWLRKQRKVEKIVNLTFINKPLQLILQLILTLKVQ